jgi:type II secretory pathway component PulK
MIIVLAVFAVVAILAGVWCRRIVYERRHQRLVDQRIQAEWLAEAGVRRAAAQLAVDGEYRGETWHIEGSELESPSPAVVDIRVEPLDSAAANVRIVAQARYPEGARPARFTKSVTFTPPGKVLPP